MKRARRAVAKPVASIKSERPVVLDVRQAGQYLGVSASTLKQWRVKRIGPKWIKLGARRIGYRLTDLEQYLEDNSKNG